MLLLKRALTITNSNMNMVFINHSEEDVIYPLTVKEIAQAQNDDAVLRNSARQTSISLNW
jgi:hypothetical protein